VPVISMRHTSAWPLALVYGLLIVFASLFPFDGWRAQGIDPSVFLFARIPPPYWTWFDVNTNIVGYAPLGFPGAGPDALGPAQASRAAAFLAGTLLSLCMEFLQIYLPRRVPSIWIWCSMPAVP
jgi:VanZ family protein